MIKYIRSHVGVKLFLSYIAVIGIASIILFFSTRLALPRAFDRHLGMAEGMQMVGEGMMNRMFQNPKDGGRFGVSGGGPQELFFNFKASFNEALIYSGVAAIIIALLVSWIFSRSVVAPVRVMMAASHRIADGHYEERIDKKRSDELGQLARSFDQMAVKLEQVETRRRQLIGDVSHELRTPLTAIKGSMEGLIDGILPANEETYLQIHQEAGRLGRLVDDLQELSRVEAGAYSMQVRPVELSPLVETVIKRLSIQFDEKGVDLTSNLPANLPRILGDGDRVIQILTNLIGNALSHTPAGGAVTVSAVQQGKFIHILVEDSGIGISQENLRHIFTRFYRVDKSRSRQSGGGSGIGLTVAKHLVEAHGGEIWAESGGDGMGSKFSFTFKIE